MKYTIEVKSPLMITNGTEIYRTWQLFPPDEPKVRLIDMDRTMEKCDLRDIKDLLDQMDKYYKFKPGSMRHEGSGKMGVGYSIPKLQELNKRKKLSFYTNQIIRDRNTLKEETEIKMIYHDKVLTSDGIKIVPYIPGSSLKGAIRNAILFSRIKYDERFKQPFLQEPEKNQFIYARLEEIDRDVFEFLEITDFYPQENNFELGIVMIERRSNNARARGIPILGMAVKKGSFTGRIGMSQTLRSRLKFLDDSEKSALISKFAETFADKSDVGKLISLLSKMDSNVKLIEIENFISKRIIKCLNDFTNLNTNRSEVNNEKLCQLYLGFGKGSTLTTVIGALNKRELDKIKQKKYVYKTLPKNVELENLHEPKSQYMYSLPFSDMSKIGLCNLSISGEEE